MQQHTSLPSAAELFLLAFERITTSGTHLSAELDQLFRTLEAPADMAARLRHRLYQAVRYNDVHKAWNGALDGIVDVKRAYRPSWLDHDLLSTAWLADAATYVRVNTLRTTVEDCCKALAPFQPVVVSDTCVCVDEPFGLFRSEAFRKGWFEQQDVTSQRVGTTIYEHVLKQARWKLIVDLCAGAGGKTLHLAALAGNSGRILAMDIHEDRLDTLRKRATRAGATNIETRHISTTKTIKRQYGKVDFVLVDAPCSGTGVLRRNPDILYHLTPDSVDELVKTQAELLQRAIHMCKPGGYVAYVTCSILPRECRLQVEHALATNAVSIAHEWSTATGEDGGDAFYFCLLRVPETSTQFVTR